MNDIEKQDGFVPSRKKSTSFLMSQLREAGEDKPFLLSDARSKAEKQQASVKEAKKVKKEASTSPENDMPFGEQTGEEWIDAFIDLKLGKPRRKGLGGYHEKQEKKKKKNKGNKELTDFSKKFASESSMLTTLLTEQMNFTAQLQDKLNHSLSSKPTAAGLSKYTTDYIVALNGARQLAMQLVEKKVNLKKTITELSMKEKKEFGKDGANDAANLNAYSTSMMKNIMSNRSELINAGPTIMPQSVSDINDYPDIDDLLSNNENGIMSAQSDAELYLKYEQMNIKVHIEYYGRDNDAMDYEFVATDEDGNVVDDYPLPYKTKLSINRSTGFATDANGERYRIIFMDGE